MTFSISYQEVKDYVKNLPRSTTKVGETCNSQKCVIARAVWEKYPGAVWVWVEPARHVKQWIRVFWGNNTDGTVDWNEVDTGNDEELLRQVALGFDRIDNVCPTRTTVLKFFKELEKKEFAS